MILFLRKLKEVIRHCTSILKIQNMMQKPETIKTFGDRIISHIKYDQIIMQLVLYAWSYTHTFLFLCEYDLLS